MSIIVKGENMQKMVSDFMFKYKLQNNGEIRYIDLVSEVGELGKEIIQGSNYGKNCYAKTKRTQDEIGDCLFSLFALCCSLDINAEEALKNSMLKYEKRFEEKGDICSHIYKNNMD